MRKNSPCILVATFLLASVVLAADKPPSYTPLDGFVPNEQTAIRIATAIWIPIYGAENIAREKPYKATLRADGVWLVRGSLPKGWIGGVAEAEISKVDGRVLRVFHGK